MNLDWHATNARIRRGFVHYATGKLFSAPLSLITLVLLARLLPAGDYAAWLTCMAVVEITIVVAGLGLEWLMQTTSVAVQSTGNARQVQRVRLLFIGLPIVFQALAGAVVFALAQPLSYWLAGVASPAQLQLAAAVIALEGPVRLLRDSFMPILMMQAQAQWCTVIRVLGLLMPVAGWAWLRSLSGSTTGWLFIPERAITADGVLLVEIFASMLTLISVLLLLAMRLWRDRSRVPMPGSVSRWLGWPAWRFAFHAWLSILMMLLLGTDLLITQVARHLGPEATAAFGFAVRWLEVIRRYLPVDLFWGAVRPAVIARHQASGGDPQVLLRDAWRMVAANLSAVFAVLLLTLAVGDAVLVWLSAARVSVLPGLLACLILLLIGHSLRRVIELIAYLAGASGAFAIASLVCLAGPLAVSLALQGWPVPHAAALAAASVDLLVVCIAAALVHRQLPLISARRLSWISRIS